jgi:protein-S-isoprenylcysteine O-methyltransferase Ste14
VVRIGVVAFAAFVAAVSLALLGSFAVSAVGQPSGITNVVGVLIACVAGLCFFRVGRTIWREMREKEPDKRR